MTNSGWSILGGQFTGMRSRLLNCLAVVGYRRVLVLYVAHGELPVGDR
ncbi:MAG: hypothetical protein HC881_18190 [Leptolyngbyaceae cyanobacterium SL_7_1]|nr:hypothetical protein [Leptolyngbyaceae cyanobacterium SL_7_1]